MRSSRFSFAIVTLILLLAATFSTESAAAQERPRVNPDDYGKFENVLAPTLSPDGRWLTHLIRKVNAEEELHLRALASNVSGADTLRSFPWGAGASFSADSRWVAWRVGMSPDERDRLRRSQTPVRDGAALLDLTGRSAGATGTDDDGERLFSDVRAFSFDPGGRFLALHGYPPEEPRGRGADLRVLDLHGDANANEVNFGNVAAYSWSPDGALLALVIATGSEDGNAIHLYDAGEGRIRVLDHSTSSYRHPVWHGEEADLVVLGTVDTMGADSTAHQILAWRGLDTASPRRYELTSASAGLPDTLRITGFGAARWTEDGRRISFGVRPGPVPDADDEEAEGEDEGDENEEARPRPASRSNADDDTELPSLQLWHTRDVLAVSQQQSRANAAPRRTLLAVWTPGTGGPGGSGLVTIVGTDVEETAALTRDGAFGIERISAPYPWGTMFGRPYHDAYVVDIEGGARTRVFEEVRYSWPSAEGRYLLTFDGTDYHAIELATGARANLTSGLDGVFANVMYDTPTDLLPPLGIGGWVEGDAAVFLYDRHDVWRVAPDGSGGERITRGAEDDVIHRIVRPGPAAHAWAPDESLWFGLRGEWTEERGYARLDPGAVTPTRLAFEDRMVSGLVRADSADVYLVREEARDISPNLFVTGPEFTNRRRVTNTNPFLADYAWTRAELIDFTSEAGERLQGVLLYPVNHDPGRRYPMIVYTYEMLSQQMHNFQVPSERSYYNFTAWTQNEYFVLLPDIRYRARDPGVSAIEAVRPAVGTVVERGLVDAARVGLIGHSWGGYQATYIPTRTNLFAASVAGAPLTDFVSFMGQIHWNGGAPELTHWETGQGRMEVPYWEDPEAHHRNSPLHAVQEMDTPLLMAFGDQDGVVEWWQGTVFYNFARRAERHMVLLVYEGEDHGFTREPNQIDYHRRILEWFGHYLKGEPAPRWITDGIPLADVTDEARRIRAPNGGDG